MTDKDKKFEEAKKLHFATEWYEHPDLKDFGPQEYAKNQKACLEALDYYNRKDRPLNILAVHGSGRHPSIGCSYEIPNSEMLLEKGLDPYRNEGYEIESVRLREYNISPCNSCFIDPKTKVRGIKGWRNLGDIKKHKGVFPLVINGKGKVANVIDAPSPMYSGDVYTITYKILDKTYETEVTADHKFFNPNGEPIEAQFLKSGQSLQRVSPDYKILSCKVINIKKDYRENVKTYCLTMEGHPSFVVNGGLVSHNCVSTASLMCQFPCLCHPMDPMQDLYPKTLRADVLLMSTPVNQAAMSTRLKAYLDRLISCFLDPDTEVFTLRGYKAISRMGGKNKIKGSKRAVKLLNGEGKWESPSNIIHNYEETYTGTAYEISIKDSFGNTNKFTTTDDHMWVTRTGNRSRSDKLSVGDSIVQLAQKCVYCEKVIPLSNRVTCSKECFSAVSRKGLAERRDGKTYEEWLGKDKAMSLKEKRRKLLKERNPSRDSEEVRIKIVKSASRSWNDRIGDDDKVAEMKRKAANRIKDVHKKPGYSEKLSNSLRNSEKVKYNADKRRGVTEVERFGKEKAEEIQRKRNLVRQRSKENNLEKVVYSAICDAGFECEREVSIGRYCVDFYISSLSLIVEADGAHWHNSKHDFKKDMFLKGQGYDVLRIKDSDYNRNLKRIYKATLEQLTLLKNNHEGNFVKTEAIVTNIKTRHVENVQKYCFTMDDDHSFVVAGGIVSGNCDGGVYHDFAVKDAEFRNKAIQASRDGNFEYTQRLFGRVGAYFISAKDQDNPSDKDYDYIKMVADTLKIGNEAYGILAADKWYVGNASKWDEDYSWDKKNLNDNKSLHKEAQAVVGQAISLAKEVREDPPDPIFGRINRT